MKKSRKLLFVFFLTSSLVCGGINIANASSDKVLIRNLFYGMQAAVSKGSAAEIAYMEKNIYPHAMNMGTNWQHWKTLLIQAGFEEISTPDLSTMDTDPTWIPNSSFCSAGMSQPPKGKTYTFSASSTVVMGGKSLTATNQEHATILNGKAYFYFDLCRSAG